jgi:hypothetical protein
MSFLIQRDGETISENGFLSRMHHIYMRKSISQQTIYSAACGWASNQPLINEVLKKAAFTNWLVGFIKTPYS